MITARSIDQLYKMMAQAIMIYGEPVTPRNLGCLELSPGFFTIRNVFENILVNPNRKISKAYAAAELFWILLGRNDVAFLDAYNSHIKDWSDDGKTFNGAYGPRLMPQFAYLIEKLTKDKDTRQAVATIWTPSPAPSKDIPCTIALQFLPRGGKLNLIVTMRSNDFWLGLPYDVHTFTCLQIILAGLTGLNVGWYKHVAGSMHHYSTSPQLATISDGSGFFSESTPIINYSLVEFQDSLRLVEKLHEGMLMNPIPETVEKTILGMHPFFRQKLLWMLAHRRAKNATQVG